MDFIWDKLQIVNGEPSDKILIIARRRSYFEAWCRIHNVNPRSGLVRLVMRPEDVHGIAGYYVDLGTDDAELRRTLDQLKHMEAIKPLHTPNI